jgi:hypothetical protein
VEVLKEVARANPNALEEIIKRDAKLKDIQYLDASPLAALDLHLNRRLDDLPLGHFILRNSRYDLTGLDITNIWDEYRNDPHHSTVVQFCAGDTTAIRWLDDEVFARRLVREIRRYFPFDPADVDWRRTTAMKHIEAPLFMNEVGSNSRRVQPGRTGVRDLYIIGDHAHTPVDLACMEGAVYSALLAAKSICRSVGVEGSKPKQLLGVSRRVRWPLKVLRYPLGWSAIPVRLVTEPYYSRERRLQERARLDGS